MKCKNKLELAFEPEKIKLLFKMTFLCRIVIGTRPKTCCHFSYTKINSAFCFLKLTELYFVKWTLWRDFGDSLLTFIIHANRHEEQTTAVTSKKAKQIKKGKKKRISKKDFQLSGDIFFLAGNLT